MKIIEKLADQVRRPLDDLATYATASLTEPAAPTRYAIRQALDQEYQKYLINRTNEARQARYNAGQTLQVDEQDESEDAPWNHSTMEGNASKVKPERPQRDFFGRLIDQPPRPTSAAEKSIDQPCVGMSKSEVNAAARVAWVSFHEGFSNAVRKPITLEELLRSF